jgi:hypothetical protein
MLKIKTNTALARSTGAVAAAAAAFAVMAAGCSEASTAHSADGKGAVDVAIVFQLDVTSSVANSFRADAQDAFAKAIVRLSRRPHGAITVYVRKIDHTPGLDEAALGTYHIDAVHECPNPFDQDCRGAEGRPVRQAQAIARKIRAIHEPVARAGTIIRGGLAVAGENLAGKRGEKWLVVASDMRPSHTRPKVPPVVKLGNVNVVVLYACSQGIAQCQERRNAWRAELEHDGAVHPVPFLFSQQMNELKLWR